MKNVIRQCWGRRVQERERELNRLEGGGREMRAGWFGGHKSGGQQHETPGTIDVPIYLCSTERRGVPILPRCRRNNA